MTEGTFVCIDCGFAGTGPRSLMEAHWRAMGHGPENAQREALRRARASIAPAPPSTTTDGGLVLRLKPPADPPGDLA